MNILLGISVMVFFGLFGAVNYYIGARVFHVVGRTPFINGRLYWILFWFIALSYVVAMLTRKFMPRLIENTLMWIGSYWIGAMLYFTATLLVFDLIFIVTRWTGIVSREQQYRQSFYSVTGMLSLVIVFGVLIYGTWNARTPHVTNYDIDIKKPAGNIRNLNVIMVSDLHLGDMVGNSRLERMVEEINKLQPDVVLLGGDIVNEDAAPYVRQNMGETFKRLKTKYGVYAVLGNHEYARGQVEEIISNLSNSGIKVLRDDYIKIENSIYIAGRDDISKERYLKEKRKPLEELMGDLDKSLPVILLDHKPQNLEEVEKNGVDIQLSGHTHGGGQIIPDALLYSNLYEVAYGYLAKGETHVLVSSGYGTWGPPFRIGNKCEIVQVNINFNK